MVQFINTGQKKNSGDTYKIAIDHLDRSGRLLEVDVLILIVDELVGNYCIIPEHVRRKYSAGNSTVTIISPNSKIEHWSKPYWNNFDVFK